jgi:hypothetical protein
MEIQKAVVRHKLSQTIQFNKTIQNNSDERAVI